MIKRKITKCIRFKIWTHYNGQHYYGLCFTCGDGISILNFHCGHVTAETNGGVETIENLRPVCQHCNTSMGERHMEEYMTTHKYIRNKYWNGYTFEHMKKCKIINCLKYPVFGKHCEFHHKSLFEKFKSLFIK